jgi:hypothetical protein
MTTKGLDRQPTKLDYASPTQFKFNIIKLPKVEYFCTSVNIPGISLIGDLTMPTPLRDIPLPGEKLNYRPLSMSFLVDENLVNYREIHGWLTGLGFPKSHTEFATLQASGEDRYPTTTSNISSEVGQPKYGPGSEGGIYSDAILTILTSKNNPVMEVRFSDVYPTSLSGLSYDQQAEDVAYLNATIEMEYKLYEFAEVGSSSTTVTTS